MIPRCSLDLHFSKDPDAGKDRGQEEKGVTENKMVGWHHRLNGRGFKEIQGDIGR